jgi:hypothetical protein
VRARRITDTWVHPPAVRGRADRRPAIINRHDFALVAMFGLLGLRIFEATRADIADLGEEPGHRAGQNLNRHPNYILAAHMVSGT